MSDFGIYTKVRLSLMMFLQFMLFAVWWVPLAAYLTNMNVAVTHKALILSSMAIGCLASPIIGMIADRHFASERVLTFLNLLTAILLFFAAGQQDPKMLFLLLLLAMFAYMPTWGLTSAIAMAHSPSEQFPRIRVFGSIGWVASGLFSLVAVKLFHTDFDGTQLPIYCGAGTALLAAGINFTLPHTPPPGKGQKSSIVDALGLRALSLMKDKNFAVFIVVSFLAMIPFSIYWSYCSEFLLDKGFKYITVTMNWGQFAEMFFMIMVTVALAKMGMKKAMMLGLIALIVRYIAFYAGGKFDQEWMYYLAILVHGIIYGFFFVGGQIYIDKKSPDGLRAQAQGLIFLVTFGAGLLAGNFINGKLIEHYSVDVSGTLSYNWNAIWGVTSISSIILLLIFLLLFRDKKLQ